MIIIYIKEMIMINKAIIIISFLIFNRNKKKIIKVCLEKLHLIYTSLKLKA